jgi:hypothetical protein
MAQPPTASITSNFPFPELTPFATDLQPPTHGSLRVLQRELNSNAMSVHSNYGGGRYGHLTLTMDNIAYTALPHTVAYPAPVAPPAAPVIPANPTSAQINEAVRNHQEKVKIFNRYFDTDRALVRLIIAATPDTYIKALLDPMFGYANVTTLSLLTHLQTTYGEMTAADREANLARMNAPWSPPSPIENLFDQLEEGQRYAVLALIEPNHQMWYDA